MHQRSGTFQGEAACSVSCPGPEMTPADQKPANESPLAKDRVPLPSFRPAAHSPSYFEPSAWWKTPWPCRLSSSQLPSYLGSCRKGWVYQHIYVRVMLRTRDKGITYLAIPIVIGVDKNSVACCAVRIPFSTKHVTVGIVQLA